MGKNEAFLLYDIFSSSFSAFADTGVDTGGNGSIDRGSVCKSCRITIRNIWSYTFVDPIYLGITHDSLTFSNLLENMFEALRAIDILVM